MKDGNDDEEEDDDEHRISLTTFIGVYFLLLLKFTELCRNLCHIGLPVVWFWLKGEQIATPYNTL